MEYSYVNPEWKQKNEKKNKGGTRVGLAVLLSCVVIATVVGLFAGVMLADRYLKETAPVQTAIEAPMQELLPAHPQTAGLTEGQVSESRDSEPVKGETAAVVSSGFAESGQFTRAQVCEIAAPSVVGIDTISTVSYWGRLYETPGSGSGVILTEDGYIATCAHVVDGAQSIKVTLNDDTEHEATLVGSDSRKDLAIIKIEATGMQAAVLGDSDMLTVGEDVIAIGNPLGELRGTATSGIISALRREVTVESTEMELVQTDAAISPGNSGGGLFNASGKLIGIVNAKASGNNAEGLGFAIPINDVIGEINDLLNYGYITGRAYLGVYTQNRSLGTDYGYWRTITATCVQVTDVVKGSAAEAADIRVGDLILSVDGKDVTSNDVLGDLIAGYNAGDTATLVIQRDGKRFEASVTFGEYKPQP